MCVCVCVCVRAPCMYLNARLIKYIQEHIFNENYNKYVSDSH